MKAPAALLVASVRIHDLVGIDVVSFVCMPNLDVQYAGDRSFLSFSTLEI